MSLYVEKWDRFLLILLDYLSTMMHHADDKSFGKYATEDLPFSYDRCIFYLRFFGNKLDRNLFYKMSFSQCQNFKLRFL